jgi:DNA-binding NarL/FixJ family response regulator
LAEGKGLRQSAAVSLETAGWHLIVAGTGAEALQKAGEFAGTIHLLVANLDIADMTGIELAKRLNEGRPDTRILLVSSVESGMLTLGHGWHFLPAPFETVMFLNKVLDLLEGSGQLIQKHGPAVYSNIESGKLTNREVEILKLIAIGNSTKQAAALLGIAFKTVVGHRSSLMKKLDIHDTTALVRYAIREGFIDS